MLFDSRKVTELKGLSYKQRMQAIRLAYEETDLLIKALLNFCKFALLTPVFFVIAKQQDWSVLPWILLTFFLYPILTKPLTIYFVRPQLAAAAKQVLTQSVKD